MKKSYFTLILALLFTSISFAQGISVQGIARDNTSSSITNTDLSFTFSITKDDNTVVFAEKQSIRTDNFGVFSHIVSSGNPTVHSFNNVNFNIDNLKLIVSVKYNGNEIEVYNQPFQYTPYAHFAANGSPTGSVVAYLGIDAPKGWVFCKGQNLESIPGTEKLRTLLGGNTAPDLQGMFLRGTGTSPVNGKAGPALKGTQNDDNKSHTHNSGDLEATTTQNGSHAHSVTDYEIISSRGYSTVDTNRDAAYDDYKEKTRTSSSAGSHGHSVSISGNTSTSGGTETRPVNYGVNYIIKL